VATSHSKELIEEVERRINTFLQTSNKPASQKLLTLSVSSSASLEPHVEVSEFLLGDWLVGLFCLIPIQVAIVGADRFIPMKDGFRSREFEDKILGVELETVASRSGISIHFLP
jgi:hypothetical protein